jgi:hypothetical protein
MAEIGSSIPALPSSAQYIESAAGGSAQAERVTQAQNISPTEPIRRLALSDYENNDHPNFRKALNVLGIMIDLPEQSEGQNRLFSAQNIQVNTDGVGVYIHNALLNRARALEQSVTQAIDRLTVDIIHRRVTRDIVKNDGSFSLFDEFLMLKYDICPKLMQAIHTLAQHDYARENFTDFDDVEETVENASTRLNRAKLEAEMEPINKWPYIIKFIVFTLSFSMVWILYSYTEKRKGDSPSIWPVIVATIAYFTSLLFLGGDVWD